MNDRAEREAAGRRRAAVLQRAFRWTMLALVCAIATFAFMVVQAFAIRSGMESWADWHVAFDWLVAIAVAPMPAIGSGVAGLGAVAGWGWSTTTAAAVFVIPVAVFVLQNYAKRRGLALKERAKGAFSGAPDGSAT